MPKGGKRSNSQGSLVLQRDTEIGGLEVQESKYWGSPWVVRLVHVGSPASAPFKLSCICYLVSSVHSVGCGASSMCTYCIVPVSESQLLQDKTPSIPQCASVLFNTKIHLCEAARIATSRHVYETAKSTLKVVISRVSLHECYAV